MSYGIIVVMYIEKVPNRNSPPAVLLRESYREEGKVKKRTLANLSKLPEDVVKNMTLALKGASLSINETSLSPLVRTFKEFEHAHEPLEFWALLASCLELQKRAQDNYEMIYRRGFQWNCYCLSPASTK